MRVRVVCLGLAAAVAAACSASNSGDGSAPPVTGGTVTGGSAAPEPAGTPDASAPSVDAGGGATTPPAPPAPIDAGSPPPPAAACPTTSQWGPGDAKTISLAASDAAVRSYDVYVGKNVKPGAAVPLVVNMHGLNNNPALQASFSQMNPVADANGFVVVYPAGLNASFNAGNCCGASAMTGVDDLDFVRAVVADAETKICIDTKRVYETGFSNGGMMAYELACNAADLFAAVAPTEGDNETISCHPSRPVPLAAFQSLGDPVITAPNAQKSATAWATQVGCTDASPAQTTKAGFACQEWSSCSGGAQVWYCTMPGGTHYPPLGSAPVIWSFLSQFTLP